MGVVAERVGNGLRPTFPRRHVSRSPLGPNPARRTATLYAHADSRTGSATSSPVPIPSFIVSAYPEDGAVASHRGCNSGFGRFLGGKRAGVTDYSGNTIFNTLGNIAVNPARAPVLGLRGRRHPAAHGRGADRLGGGTRDEVRRGRAGGRVSGSESRRSPRCPPVALAVRGLVPIQPRVEPSKESNVSDNMAVRLVSFSIDRSKAFPH